MDRAVIASLAAVIMTVSALGITTWLSFRANGALRAHEQAVVDEYKKSEDHSVQLEQDLTAVTWRVVTLEQQLSEAREGAARQEQEASAARQAAREANERAMRADRETADANAKERTAQLDVEEIRKRLEALGMQVRTATERATVPAEGTPDGSGEAKRADRETADATVKERAAQLDVTEIRQRLEALGIQVRTATERATVTSEGTHDGSGEASRDKPSSPIVESLRKYAGTKAAVFVINQVADAPAAGGVISATLRDAGWASQTWKWIDVAGIFGVVVLVKGGSDPATNEAAAALVEQLRATGFSVTKGEWPADWRRHRGVLDGPQTPDPTEAPIRIVIGMKPR